MPSETHNIDPPSKNHNTLSLRERWEWMLVNRKHISESDFPKLEGVRSIDEFKSLIIEFLDVNEIPKFRSEL